MPLDMQVKALAGILRRVTKDEENYKVIVFFTTARVTGFMAELFNKMGTFGNVLEIHSRKSQSARTKTSDEFRRRSKVIMFTSDVSARGMDYPDVTFVVQVGLTGVEQYIHRLGRTARAGKEGGGILLLADFEERNMKRVLGEMPLKQLAESDLELSAVGGAVDSALGSVKGNEQMERSACMAYSAWLGFYNGNKKNCGFRSNEVLVDQANGFARCMGLDYTPMLEPKTVGKMGLRGTNGLNVGIRNRDSGGGRGGGGGGGGGRGGGGVH